MIPLRDVIPSRTFPAVTVSLIGLNAVMFLYQQSLTATALSAVAYRYGVTPAAFDWLSLVTASFVHEGWLPFGVNMLMLWLFGETLEDRTGRGRFVVFYLICGALASLGHAWIGTGSGRPAVGASGAVAGILGAYFVMYPRSRILTFVPVPSVGPLIEVTAVAFLGVWLFVQLLSSTVLMTAAGFAMLEGFSFAACAAAFIGGAMLIPVFQRAERLRVEWWHDAAG
jgi:membrane associated rhomboid family serine protease